MPEKDRQEQQFQEFAISATDLDFIQVAKRTGGNLTFAREHEPHVSWNNGRADLSWEPKYDYKAEKLTEIPNERTLNLWRGEWGGSGMEFCGVVMGRDFVAFVHPQKSTLFTIEEGELAAEIIKKGKIKSIIEPAGVFNPLFVEAREIADKNVEALVAHQE